MRASLDHHTISAMAGLVSLKLPTYLRGGESKLPWTRKLVYDLNSQQATLTHASTRDHSKTETTPMCASGGMDYLLQAVALAPSASAAAPAAVAAAAETSQSSPNLDESGVDGDGDGDPEHENGEEDFQDSDFDKSGGGGKEKGGDGDGDIDMKEVHSRGRLASEFTAPQRKVTKKSAALYTAQQRSHMIALGTELKWKLRNRNPRVAEFVSEMTKLFPERDWAPLKVVRWCERYKRQQIKSATQSTRVEIEEDVLDDDDRTSDDDYDPGHDRKLSAAASRKRPADSSDPPHDNERDSSAKRIKLSATNAASHNSIERILADMETAIAQADANRSDLAVLRAALGSARSEMSRLHSARLEIQRVVADADEVHEGFREILRERSSILDRIERAKKTASELKELARQVDERWKRVIG